MLRWWTFSNQYVIIKQEFRVSVLGGAMVLACSALREFEEQKLVSTMAHQSLACTSGQDLINWFFVCDSIFAIPGHQELILWIMW